METSGFESKVLGRIQGDFFSDTVSQKGGVALFSGP
jgi:hypothetical protein